jgi:hypothetical protein
MNDQMLLPKTRFLPRALAILIAAAVTYVLYIGWDLGKLVSSMAAALGQRPLVVSRTQRVGEIWQYWVIAAGILLAISTLVAGRFLRAISRLWLASIGMFAALNWIAFGFEWWIPASVAAAGGVTWWLDRRWLRAA